MQGAAFGSALHLLLLSASHRFRHPDAVYSGTDNAACITRPHFPKGKAFRDPLRFQMLGRSEFALRQGFAYGKTLVRR